MSRTYDDLWNIGYYDGYNRIPRWQGQLDPMYLEGYNQGATQRTIEQRYNEG